MEMEMLTVPVTTVPVTTVSVAQLTEPEVEKAKGLQDFYQLILSIFRMVTNSIRVEFYNNKIAGLFPCHYKCKTGACEGCGTPPAEFIQALELFNVLYEAGSIPSKMVPRCIEFVKTFKTSEISTFEGARNCLYPKYYPNERCNIDVSTTEEERNLLDLARIFFDFLQENSD